MSLDSHPFLHRLGPRLFDASARASFVVWAPFAESVEVALPGSPGGDPRAEDARLVRLAKSERGYFAGEADGVEAGTPYLIQLDGNPEKRRPDPASRLQPEGVHGPSAIVSGNSHAWRDGAWRGVDLAEYVIYELHLGTFTQAGTLDAAIDKLAYLVDLGVTAVELMPVAHFPGSRNWGYDGVNLFATHTAYGGPEALKRFVDACHGHGLAVVLDVVYNHLGPEGNYLREFGPYFIDAYRTPWGDALNFDHAHCDEVRTFFLSNALQWLGEFHIDALRLDAIHAIFDNAGYPFLEELADTVRREVSDKRGYPAYLIAESDLNDPRLVRPGAQHGYGLDSMWCDDLHHAVHAWLTGERNGYYADFGEVGHVVRAYNRGMAYAGEFSEFRQRRHGRAPTPDAPLAPRQIVVAAQTHDQVGNRMLGERLPALIDFEACKLAAAIVYLSPFVPLLFMGEEYGETRPFLYFIDHGDAKLIEAVRKGRKREFAAFAWQGEPPDPASAETFERCKLGFAQTDKQQAQLTYSQELLALRKRLRRDDAAATAEVVAGHADVVLVKRHLGEDALPWWFVWNMSGEPRTDVVLSLPTGRWGIELASSDKRFAGPGPDLAATVVDADAPLSLAPYAALVMAPLHS